MSKHQAEVSTAQIVIAAEYVAALKKCANELMLLPAWKRNNPHLAEQVRIALHALELAEKERSVRARQDAEAIVGITRH